MAVRPGNGDIIPGYPAGVDGRGAPVQGGELRAAHGPLRPALSREHQSPRAGSIPCQRRTRRGKTFLQR